MEARGCVACGERFYPRPQNKVQQYCSMAACQRARKREWARRKRKSDPDYRGNQHASQQRWSAKNPDYWRDYRRNNPDYTERNRTMQRQRDHASHLAKLDASTPETPVFSGRFQLIPIDASGLAKMAAWTVNIHPVSSG